MTFWHPFTDKPDFSDLLEFFEEILEFLAKIFLEFFPFFLEYFFPRSEKKAWTNCSFSWYFRTKTGTSDVHPVSDPRTWKGVSLQPLLDPTAENRDCSRFVLNRTPNQNLVPEPKNEVEEGEQVQAGRGRGPGRLAPGVTITRANPEQGPSKHHKLHTYISDHYFNYKPNHQHGSLHL